MFLAYLIIIIVGACIGSFLSVIYFRTAQSNTRPTRRDIITGRSFCQHSGKNLKRYELIPVISYIRQQGKSNYTAQKLSRVYLANEITIPFLRCLIFYLGQQINLPTYEIIFHIVTRSLLLQLIRYDLHKQLLHEAIRRITSVRIVLYTMYSHHETIIPHMAMTMILVVIGLIIYGAAKKYAQRKYPGQTEGFGQGDIRMLGLLGRLLPYLSYYHPIATTGRNYSQIIIYFFIIASFIGLAQAGLSYTLTHKGAKYIAFFPGLIIATACIIIFAKFLPL